MRHRLSIDTNILERYPTYSLLIIYAEGLTNGPSDAESCALLRAAEQQCRATLAAETLTMQPHIAAWREVYRSFGAKPKKYPCSLEALLARALKGQELPQINRLVDMYNAISLKHLLPAGGEDWDRTCSILCAGSPRTLPGRGFKGGRRRSHAADCTHLPRGYDGCRIAGCKRIGRKGPALRKMP